MRVKISILPQQEIDNMLELATQMEEDCNKQYANLQKAIIDPLANYQAVIEQLIMDYEQRAYNTIPTIIEKCRNLNKLDLVKTQAEQIKLIEGYLHAVKKNNEDIIARASKLRVQMGFAVH